MLEDEEFIQEYLKVLSKKTGNYAEEVHIYIETRV